MVIGYKAPDVGNFDLPAEIDGLSMWSIQKDTTLKPLVKDAISLGLESKLNKAEQSLRNSQTIFNLRKSLMFGMVSNSSTAKPVHTLRQVQIYQKGGCGLHIHKVKQL